MAQSAARCHHFDEVCGVEENPYGVLSAFDTCLVCTPGAAAEEKLVEAARIAKCANGSKRAMVEVAATTAVLKLAGYICPTRMVWRAQLQS